MLRLLACALLAGIASAQVTYYSAALDPAQEVPATASSGRGWGIVRLDASTNGVQLFCYHTGLTSTSIAAHIHQGAAGINGPVIIGMSLVGPNTWAGAGTMSAAQVTALNTGGMYLNVHTTVFGGGEIRGQVTLPKSTRFTANLTGAQEVPPTGSAATGTAVAFLHEPDNRLVYIVNSTGLTNVIAAHHHQGVVGANGPIIVPLNGANGVYGGVSDKLSPALVASLMADGFYTNIHTTAFPGGEIRGQLRKDVGDHFFAVMNAASETPPTASTGFGGSQLILGPTGVATFTGQFTGLTSAAIAAHIHLGAVGVAGPIAIPLVISGNNLSATFTPTPTQLNDLRTGNWYVNVHSVVFGGGEIRGQLLPAALPSVYGEGCPSTTGFIPHMGMTGFACMGGNTSFDVYGVPPGSFSLLFVADVRDPAPVELPAIGLAAPGCFALVLSNLLQFTQIANAQGYAQQPVPVPLAPALRNIPLYAQYATFDVGINAANLVTSNAVSFAIL